MTNNEILRRIRYLNNYDDAKMVSIFALADLEVTPRQIVNWLKKEENRGYQVCRDKEFSSFLNGLIIEKRGVKEGEQPKPEMRLSNNIIFRKLKIALRLESDQILEIMRLAGLPISKHELSAFFRRTDHKHFRLCKDQMLRNFLNGLQMKQKGQTDPKKKPDTRGIKVGATEKETPVSIWKS